MDNTARKREAVRAERRCDCTWTGFTTSHCPVCHAIFSSNYVGDRHRVGPFDPPGQRRCLTPDEMRAKGWVQNAKGWWGRPGPEDGSTAPREHRNRVVS